MRVRDPCCVWRKLFKCLGVAKNASHKKTVGVIHNFEMAHDFEQLVFRICSQHQYDLKKFNDISSIVHIHTQCTAEFWNSFFSTSLRSALRNTRVSACISLITSMEGVSTSVQSTPMARSHFPAGINTSNIQTIVIWKINRFTCSRNARVTRKS
jgi:hypothetical protein